MNAISPGPSSPEPGRRLRRHPIAIPVDISVFRAGKHENIPGRSVEIGEGGMSAVLSSQLHPGDVIDVEFRLPGMEAGFHAKAVVRHQGAVGCGIEFVELPPEQRELMRQWAAELPPSDEVAGSSGRARWRNILGVQVARARRSLARGGKVVRYRMPEIILVMAILALIVRWNWEREWQKIERPLRVQAAMSQEEPISVPAKVMEPLLQKKIEPAYPEAGHGASGVVLLDVIVSRAGEVERIHLISGNEALARAAAGAVKEWRFRPYEVSGEPKQVETTVAIGFRP